MTETAKEAIVSALLKPVMELWASRDERGAAHQSGQLLFWKDGMLEQLKAFADGKGTAATYRILRSKLRISEDDCYRGDRIPEKGQEQAWRWCGRESD
jgi:hypothetical protein